MRYLIAIICVVFSGLALAADPVACDVTYTIDTNVVDAQGVEHDVSTSTAVLYAVPWADVVDNSAKGLRVLNVLSKFQDKGGPYTIETGEVRSCDGGPPQKNLATSVLLKGVTLDGGNQAGREALRQAELVQARFEDRQRQGKKTGWDHSKAHKTKRNDLGQRVKD